MDEILNLLNISYKYEDKFPALRDVSVKISQGERIAVLGNNGAGKSTFFLCLNGVLRPQSGKIFLKGQEITGDKRDTTRLRQTVGLVFQEPDSQIIAGTVGSEVSFGPMNLKLPRAEVVERIAKAFKQVNLEGYDDRAPQYLSGGEKKRVTIADILVMHPEVILLDEPTASLDPENVVLLEQTLDDLSAAGITIIVSTHDVDFAYRFSERAIVFCAGEIIADADVSAVFASDIVLDKAGLKKPLLYAAAEVLSESFKRDKPGAMPRTIEEFKDFAAGIKDCVG